MKDTLTLRVKRDDARLWFLGQAGYIIRSSGTTVAIDPYLSDSVGKAAPEFTRTIPVPIAPDKLEVDVFIVTHDHLDHLDPETVGPYRRKDETLFVAPNLAAAKLASLGVPEENIVRIGRGETAVVAGVKITGVFAVPTSGDVSDTTGYLLELRNGRTVYHSSDTAYSDELISSAPHAEVLLVCINGKWGNLDAAQAAKLAGAVKPRVAIPNHYDMMAPNSVDPAEFKAVMRSEHPDIQVRVLDVLVPFTW